MLPRLNKIKRPGKRATCATTGILVKVPGAPTASSSSSRLSSIARSRTSKILAQLRHASTSAATEDSSTTAPTLPVIEAVKEKSKKAPTFYNYLDPSQSGYIPGKGVPERMAPPKDHVYTHSSGQAFAVNSGMGIADVIMRYQYVRGRDHKNYPQQAPPVSGGQINRDMPMPFIGALMPDRPSSVLESPCYNPKNDQPTEEVLPPAASPEYGGMFYKDDKRHVYSECWTPHGGTVFGGERLRRSILHGEAELARKSHYEEAEPTGSMVDLNTVLQSAGKATPAAGNGSGEGQTTAASSSASSSTTTERQVGAPASTGVSSSSSSSLSTTSNPTTSTTTTTSTSTGTNISSSSTMRQGLLQGQPMVGTKMTSDPEDLPPLPAYREDLIDEDFEVAGATGAIVARKFKAIEWTGGGIADEQPEVAPGWYQFQNREGRKWYLHPWSGRSQWKHPVSGELDTSPISRWYIRPKNHKYNLPTVPWFAIFPRHPVQTLNQDRKMSYWRGRIRDYTFCMPAFMFFCLFSRHVGMFEGDTFNNYEPHLPPTQRDLNWGGFAGIIPSEKFENWVYSLAGFGEVSSPGSIDKNASSWSLSGPKDRDYRKYSYDCSQESFWNKHHVDYETGKVTEPRKRILGYIRLTDD
ncbi:unnamed protein product [Amoebophrya sp. A25]|nr:unnamed protein product [Amoebophrya sp. A25]|eukprot:GSA25T00007225001.1